MKQVLINYMVKPEKVGENIVLIKNVFLELKATKTKDVKYSAFRMGENVFVHVAQFETPEAEEEFNRLEAFRAFRKNIETRQMEQPIVNQIEEIGSINRCIDRGTNR